MDYSPTPPPFVNRKKLNSIATNTQIFQNCRPIENLGKLKNLIMHFGRYLHFQYHQEKTFSKSLKWRVFLTVYSSSYHLESMKISKYFRGTRVKSISLSHILNCPSKNCFLDPLRAALEQKSKS